VTATDYLLGALLLLLGTLTLIAVACVVAYVVATWLRLCRRVDEVKDVVHSTDMRMDSVENRVDILEDEVDEYVTGEPDDGEGWKRPRYSGDD
jgi:HAMP domain-containing protein